MTQEPVRLIVRYRGHVQGVGFRMTAVSQAKGLDVQGFVRNEPDGSVKMDIEGNRRDLQQLMKRIASAMEGRIDDTELDERPPVGHHGGFTIQY